MDQTDTQDRRARSNGRGSARPRRRAGRRAAARGEGASGLVALQVEMARRRARDLSHQLGRLASAPTEGLRARAEALRAGIERRLDEQITLTLDRIGIPSQESIAALESQIASVSARVESLEKRSRGPRRFGPHQPCTGCVSRFSRIASPR